MLGTVEPLKGRLWVVWCRRWTHIILTLFPTECLPRSGDAWIYWNSVEQLYNVMYIYRTSQAFPANTFPYLSRFPYACLQRTPCCMQCRDIRLLGCSSGRKGNWMSLEQVATTPRAQERSETWSKEQFFGPLHDQFKLGRRLGKGGQIPLGDPVMGTDSAEGTVTTALSHGLKLKPRHTDTDSSKGHPKIIERSSKKM